MWLKNNLPTYYQPKNEKITNLNTVDKDCKNYQPNFKKVTTYKNYVFCRKRININSYIRKSL